MCTADRTLENPVTLWQLMLKLIQAIPQSFKPRRNYPFAKAQTRPVFTCVLQNRVDSTVLVPKLCSKLCGGR